MTRLIFILILIYVLYLAIKIFFKKGDSGVSGRESSAVVSEMVQDPFCKTWVPKNEAFRKVLKGKEIYFCSSECAEKYEKKMDN